MDEFIFIYDLLSIGGLGKSKTKWAESPMTSIAQGNALGYGRLWAFSPHCMSFDALSSYICKDNFELLLIVFTSSPQDTIYVCGILL